MQVITFSENDKPVKSIVKATAFSPEAAAGLVNFGTKLQLGTLKACARWLGLPRASGLVDRVRSKFHTLAWSLYAF